MSQETLRIGVQLEDGDIEEAFGPSLAGCAAAIEALRQDMRLKTHEQVMAAIVAGRNEFGHFHMETTNPTYTAVDPHPLYVPGNKVNIVMDKSNIPKMIAALKQHRDETREELLRVLEDEEKAKMLQELADEEGDGE